MTSRVIITSMMPETFTCGYAGHREPATIGQVHEAWATNQILEIMRLRDGQGFIMNVSPKVLRCQYRLAESADGEPRPPVGPNTDLIMPNTIKEIGCGPGGMWEIFEAE